MNAKQRFQKDLETSFEIERTFESLRKNASPSAFFKIRLRIKLFMAEFSNALSSFFHSLTPKRMVPHKIISGLVGLVVLFSGGVSAYAYSSESVANGHSLYGIKLAIEKLEGNAHVSPESKALFHLKLAERRLAESKHLALKGKSDANTEARMEMEVQKSEENAKEIPEESKRSEAFVKIENRLQGRIEALNSLLEKVRGENENDINTTEEDNLEDTGEAPKEQNDLSKDMKFGVKGTLKALERANMNAEMKTKVETRIENKIEHLNRLMKRLEERKDHVSSSAASIKKKMEPRMKEYPKPLNSNDDAEEQYEKENEAVQPNLEEKIEEPNDNEVKLEVSGSSSIDVHFGPNE